METLKNKNGLDRTLEYYFVKRNQIIDFVNTKSNLSADQIIQCGEDIAELEYKITALQIAKED